MILIDSSSWIHFLRPKGDPAVRSRVEKALQSGDACWCPLIQLELWNGAGGDREKKVLDDFAMILPELPVTEGVWQAAYNLARHARKRGITIPASDLVIAACALHHKVDLETADGDFAGLEKLIGSLRDRIVVHGDIFSTGVAWDADDQS